MMGLFYQLRRYGPLAQPAKCILQKRSGILSYYNYYTILTNITFDLIYIHILKSDFGAMNHNNPLEEMVLE